MNNRNKYLLRRALRLIKGVGLSVLYSFFFTKRTKTIIFNSACNDEFTWNAKSLFLNGLEKFKELGYEIYFVIDDEKERHRLCSIYGNYFLSSNIPCERRKIYRSAVWVLSTLETPCSGVFLSRKRFVYHLGHGTPIKNIGLEEKNVSFHKKIFYWINSTNISCFLSTSDYFKLYMAKAFGVSKNNIVVAPQPRIDDFLYNDHAFRFLKKQSGYKYVLYAPTWRHYSKTQLFPFEDFDLEKFSLHLENMKVIILLRLHPRFEDESQKYVTENIKVFNSSICPDISEALLEMDALITDYSSIYCDYLLLERPVAFIPYDQDIYSEEIGFSHDYNDMTTSIKINTMGDFFSFLENIDKPYFMSQQRELCDKLNFIPKTESATEYNIRFIDEEYKKRW